MFYLEKFLIVSKTKEPASKEAVGSKPIIKDEYLEESDTTQNGYQGKGENNTININDIMLLQPQSHKENKQLNAVDENLKEQKVPIQECKSP